MCVVICVVLDITFKKKNTRYLDYYHSALTGGGGGVRHSTTKTIKVDLSGFSTKPYNVGIITESK